MPDFEEIEKDAKDHSKQVDEGIDKVAHEADEKADGKDHGVIDKAAADLEKEL
jgi:hypothetical protein